MKKIILGIVVIAVLSGCDTQPEIYTTASETPACQKAQVQAQKAWHEAYENPHPFCAFSGWAYARAHYRKVNDWKEGGSYDALWAEGVRQCMVPEYMKAKDTRATVRATCLKGDPY